MIEDASEHSSSRPASEPSSSRPLCEEMGFGGSYDKAGQKEDEHDKN